MLECVAELLLNPVALSGDLVALGGVPLLFLGERSVEPFELGRDLVALLLQPRELLPAVVPRLGENGLQPLDLRCRPLVLVLQTVLVLVERGLCLGEGCFESFDVGQQPLLFGSGGL